MTDITEESTSRYLVVDGIRIHYNEMGTGYPVICLHGAGPGASSWSNFKQNVDALSQHYHLYLVDMPQYGKSDKIVFQEGRLTFVARILANLMKQLGIERAHFIGNSMGGQTAIKLAIDRPDLVDHLVTIGGVPMFFSIMQPMLTEGVKMIREYYMAEPGPTPQKMRKLIETFVYDASFLTDELVQERYQASIDPKVIEIFSSYQTHPRNEDLSAEFHRLKAKTLIVWGNDDRFAPLDCGLFLLRRAQNARMHVFGQCGHWAQVEHADEFNRLVLDFFASS